MPPHGADELSPPGDGFYIVGMKSYGRAPTFLLLTGYEQVRSIVAALAGDWEAARRVELVLPETGVCNRPPARRGRAARSAPPRGVLRRRIRARGDRRRASCHGRPLLPRRLTWRRAPHEPRQEVLISSPR